MHIASVDLGEVHKVMFTAAALGFHERLQKTIHVLIPITFLSYNTCSLQKKIRKYPEIKSLIIYHYRVHSHCVDYLSGHFPLLMHLCGV